MTDYPDKLPEDQVPPGWRGVPGLVVADGTLEAYEGYEHFFAAPLATPPDPTSDDVLWFGFEDREFTAWCRDPDPGKPTFEGVTGGQCFAGVGNLEVALVGGQLRFILHAFPGEGYAERLAWLEDAVRIVFPDVVERSREDLN